MVSDQWSRAPASSRSPGLASGDHAHSFAEGARAVPFTDLAAMPMPSRLVGAGSVTTVCLLEKFAKIEPQTLALQFCGRHGQQLPCIISGHAVAILRAPARRHCHHAAPQDHQLLLQMPPALIGGGDPLDQLRSQT